MNIPYSKKIEKRPAFRKLRAFVFDPSLSLNTDTVEINEIEYKIPWEDLEAGPIGEYLEIIDFDPTTDTFYQPVDLNGKYILAENGLSPSESNPQFHQQMVYAVAMITIKNFEKALGRKVVWSTRLLEDYQAYEAYVPKLRIYPHALRDANAFYSPNKKALLFGYFSSAPAEDDLHMPNSIVFTCLSHDIIAHEVTHAILDGMHRHYNMPTNPDVLAFHEAFADIVALFQHFTFPEVLKHQIAKTRGDLTSQNLLGQLAQEFGSAIGNYGSLRDAIGKVDEKTKEWKQHQPNTNEYKTVLEPHRRGSILVSAVFDVFLDIYRGRISDLIRIASSGSGILPKGELHPDLVNRMASEAAKSAQHVLNMCIRALDYCPPVDLTFGEYLRAIITADMDLVSNDKNNYRISFINAFRKRGIYPSGIKTLSIESLAHKELDFGIDVDDNSKMVSQYYYTEEIDPTTKQLLTIINSFLRDYGDAVKYVNDREDIYNLTRTYIAGGATPSRRIQGLHQRINIKFSGSTDFSKITGLAFTHNWKSLGIKKSSQYSGPSFQIQNLRKVSRVGPDGSQINHVVFSIIQTSNIIMKDKDKLDFEFTRIEKEADCQMYGGCTLIFDLDSGKLKYAIAKPLLNTDKLEDDVFEIDSKRLHEQFKFLYKNNQNLQHEFQSYFTKNGIIDPHGEPFSLLHKH